MQQAAYRELVADRRRRALAIAGAGGLEQALASGALPRQADVTLSEALVLGLVRQNVRTFVGIFGHGVTEIGEVLRVYEEAGVVHTRAVRHEAEASHAAAALRWVTGEKAAVFTSIGPGSLHAFAASLAPASDGLGVWYLFGDETTHNEGPNMQQIPKPEQDLFLRLCQTMGQGYCLHTPEAVTSALRWGLNTVDHPHRAGPFFLLLPMNTQCCLLRGFNLDALPAGAPPRLGPAVGDEILAEAAQSLMKASRVVVRVGGGARDAGPEIAALLDLVDGVAVTSPLATGVIPYSNPRNMTVGGSKGSLPGNYAMENADLLVALGTRFVCQSDSSRTNYPNVRRVVNISAQVEPLMHYNQTLALWGDVKATLVRLIEELRQRNGHKPAATSPWFAACSQKKQEWEAFKAERYQAPCLYDDLWKEKVLTQPAAVKVALDWARASGVISFFDAGDVQANGFQIVEDDAPGQTFTETGASYMGFAVSALLSTALAKKPFYGLALTGDGSFTMSPQILIDGVQHGAQGCILIFDNRRMAAISGLQLAQYEHEYATNDHVEVDYAAWARAVKGVAVFNGGRSPDELRRALDEARAHRGLSLIHLPVYYGPDPLGGMGVFGRWNVGNWCDEVQTLRHEIGL
jgi:3D-(3,5/4)-trihydroxycyclohexane-1,2-dione acylhydrolase (decyclizing)